MPLILVRELLTFMEENIHGSGVLLGMPRPTHAQGEGGQGFPTPPLWAEPGRCLPLAMGCPQLHLLHVQLMMGLG